MKYLKDIKSVFILALIFVVIAYQFKGCKTTPKGGGVTVKIDTVYKEVKVEVPKYVPKWKTKVERVEIPSLVDTAAVLKDYYTKYHIIDTLKMYYADSADHSFGYAIVDDMVGKNSIMERRVMWKYKIPFITRTVTVHPKPKAQLYIGMTANVNSIQILSAVSGALLYKTKKDHIYIANIGLADNGMGVQPFIGGGIAWKITLRKPKVKDLIK